MTSPAPFFKTRNQPLEDREKQLSNEIPRLQAEVDFMRIQHLSSSQIIAEAQDIYARRPDLSFEEKRKIVERISVGKGDISLSYVPTRFEITAERQHGHRAAVPFCQMRLRAEKPKPPAYPREPKTSGEHLWKKRLDLGLRQKDAAGQIGVDLKTLCNWERQRAEPEIRFLPSIIRFLGEDPRPQPSTLPERLRRQDGSGAQPGGTGGAARRGSGDGGEVGSGKGKAPQDHSQGSRSDPRLPGGLTVALTDLRYVFSTHVPIWAL